MGSKEEIPLHQSPSPAVEEFSSLGTHDISAPIDVTVTPYAAKRWEAYCRCPDRQTCWACPTVAGYRLAQAYLSSIGGTTLNIHQLWGSMQAPLECVSWKAGYGKETPIAEWSLCHYWRECHLAHIFYEGNIRRRGSFPAPPSEEEGPYGG